MSYSDVFGGQLLFPAQLSYLAITTAVDVELQWPREQQIGGTEVVADFLDVTTTAVSLNIDMPEATATSTGNKTTFNNVGGETFTVRDNTGGTIQQVQPGEQWVLILTDNTTTAGSWESYQLGASVAVAQASALAGAGMKAVSGMLDLRIDSDVEASTPVTVVDGDRAKCLVYTAGSGTANLPSPGTVGNDWFFMIRNSGSGTLNVVPPSGQIDGTSSLSLDPNDSCFIFTDGTDFFSIGLSSGSTIAFDFVELAVPGSGDFVLSGANLDRISYRFTGALTGNRRIVVPNTTQQYWADNQTTGAFDLEVSTAAGSGQTIPQGESAITYSDGTDVINAVSSTSVTFPITIGQGGTGATTVGGAQTNLQVPPDSRLLTAGDGIAGGGDLTADRTFTLDVNDLSSAAPATGDFLAFEDIDGGNLTAKATISDILALGVTLPSGSLGDIIYISTAPDTYSATSAISVDPADAVTLQFNGTDRFATINSGSVTLGTIMDLDNSGASTLAQLRVRNSAGGVRFDAIATTGNSRIVQTDSAGSLEDIWIQMNRNADVLLYNNNTSVARTVAAASGGMEVNNLSTGAGFERVLTTADISGGQTGVTSGPGTYYKTATTGRNFTGSPNDDPHLDTGTTLDGSRYYRFETGLFFITASSTCDVLVVVNYNTPSGLGSGVLTVDENSTAGGEAWLGDAFDSGASGGSFNLDANVGRFIIIKGFLFFTSGGASSRSIAVQWGQDTLDAGNDLNLNRGSYMIIEEIANT